MPDIFNGIYYDGKTTKPYQAKVQLEPSGLHITYSAQNKTLPINLYWQAHRIQKNTNIGQTQLQYGSDPVQLLEIPHPDFLRQMEEYYAPKPASIPVKDLSDNKIPVWFWTLLLLLLTLIPITYFWILPVLADFVAQRIPAKYEQTIGEALHKQIIAFEKVDTIKTIQMQGFARQLHFEAAYPVQITVVQKDEVNAYAVPGGNIVVQTGILNMIEKPDELAALLAHEYGHIKLRHTTRTMFRSLAGYLFVSMLLGDISGITAVLVENAHSLKSLQFSRKLETEADELGLQVLIQRHLDPFGMIRLFDYLKAKQKSEAIEFLSTHPALTTRQAHLQQLLKGRKFSVVPNDSMQFFWKRLKTP